MKRVIDFNDYKINKDIEKIDGEIVNISFKIHYLCKSIVEYRKKILQYNLKLCSEISADEFQEKEEFETILELFMTQIRHCDERYKILIERRSELNYQK